MKNSFKFLLALLILFPPTGVTSAQAGIRVLENKVRLQFPEGIRFFLSVSSDVEIESIDLVYGTDERTCQSGVAQKTLEFDPASKLSLDWEWEWIRSGVLPPGTEVWWQWEISDQNGETFATPRETIVVQDHRQSWNSITKQDVTVQWYSGSDTFGRQMHDIAVDSLQRIQSGMSLQMSDEIIISVYPTSEEVQEALLVATEWTGGVAFPDHNSMIIGVSPGELDWARRIIPHEMNHLIVMSLTFNCKGVRLPSWLSEGLAEMSEAFPDQEQVELVYDALENDDLPSLTTLAGSFSAYGDDARLSYAQSKLVVQYLVDEYGADRLAELLSVIQAGNKIDPALESVYGLDTQGLDAAWRTSLGYPVDQLTSRGEGVTATATLIPTLPPISLDLQATATSNATSIPLQNSPTIQPTSTTKPPTVTSTNLTRKTPATLPQAQSQPSYPPLLITGVIFIGLMMLAAIFFLIRRRSV